MPKIRIPTPLLQKRDRLKKTSCIIEKHTLVTLISLGKPWALTSPQVIISKLYNDWACSPLFEQYSLKTDRNKGMGNDYMYSLYIV